MLENHDVISLVNKLNNPEKSKKFNIYISGILIWSIFYLIDIQFRFEYADKVVEPAVKKLKPNEEDDVVEKKPDDYREYEDILTCSICYEIMHKSISLQPCLHSFCSGCYSDWMDKSNECPNCRLHVDRISKNHTIDNLIQVYLKNNPNRARSIESIKGLDDKNKITQELVNEYLGPMGINWKILILKHLKLYPKKIEANDETDYEGSLFDSEDDNEIDFAAPQQL